MAIILVGALVGIIYGLYLKISIATTIILLAFLLFLIQKNKHKVFFFLAKRKKIFQVIFILAIISNLYLNLINSKYEKNYQKIPEKIKTDATVISDAKETEYYYSYNIKIKNKKFILYVKKSYPQKLKYGMWITLEGTYTKPQEARNYKGFNYKEYLKTKKIYGTIKAEKVNIIKENNINFFLKTSNDIRNKIIKVTKDILPEKASSLAIGILIGEKDDIAEEINKDFSKASISHILAISGTHVSYIILGITFVLLKSKVPKRSSYLITISILILFMFITRFSPSVVRTVIMSIIMLFGKVIYRKQDTFTSISISLLIILIVNPYAIKDVGLQLSYLGTLGIVLFNRPISHFLHRNIKKKIATMLAVTISAQIMVLPITVLYFNTISTIFMISNIVAVFLAGIIILIGYVNVAIAAICMPIGKIIGILLNFVVQILIWFAKYISQIPFSSITVVTPNIILIIEYYFLVYFIYKKKYIKTIVVLIIITTIILVIIGFFPTPLQIHFVDIGQRGLHGNYNTIEEKYSN